AAVPRLALLQISATRRKASPALPLARDRVNQAVGFRAHAGSAEVGGDPEGSVREDGGFELSFRVPVAAGASVDDAGEVCGSGLRGVAADPEPGRLDLALAGEDRDGVAEVVVVEGDGARFVVVADCCAPLQQGVARDDLVPRVEATRVGRAEAFLREVGGAGVVDDV